MLFVHGQMVVTIHDSASPVSGYDSISYPLCRSGASTPACVPSHLQRFSIRMVSLLLGGVGGVCQRQCQS